jgi:glycogen operon protein
MNSLVMRTELLLFWPETVAYECRVKGLTMRHPEIKSHLRGPYAGLAHSSVIE